MYSLRGTVARGGRRATGRRREGRRRSDSFAAMEQRSLVGVLAGLLAEEVEERHDRATEHADDADGEARRRLQTGGKLVVQQVVADATGAPTVTVTEAPTRTETYAPTRMTEAPSYAPTTDTYAPTMAPTTTEAPTGMPTANMTNTTVRRRALLEKGSSFIDESVWFQRALAADKSGVVQSLRDIWGY